MFISLNWLKQYVEIPADLDPQELALKLTMSVVEVEDIVDQRTRYQNMIIGEIIEIVDHPQADKLKVCKVEAGSPRYRSGEAGSPKKLQVVCGAANIYKGMKGILALPGAMVKWHGEGEQVKLAKAKIRGVESEGMLCAPSEIGLSEKFKAEDGVVDLQGEGKVGQPVAEALGLDDVIFEIENKSITHRPDLWGHYGIAREIAAIYGYKFKELKLDDIEPGSGVDLQIKVEDKENCYRYLSLAMGNIKIGPSPLYLQRLLTAAGMRPINNLVDITNYVMLELGRPSHAFDRREITNDTIIVRRAKPGEKFTTLDGKERILSAEMCLVCDAKRATDLAGIMGGENSGIKDDTTEIILELANFNPVNIRKTANKLALRTEAAVRFEKSLDPALAEDGLKRIVGLIKELIPEAQVISKIVDVNLAHEEKREIELSLDFLNRRLGQEIPKKEAIRILESLSFGVTDKSDKLLVVPPSFRVSKDIAIPEDLVEEIARIYGFDKIKPVMPLVPMDPPEINDELMIERRVKDWLGYAAQATEVLNYSFTSEKNINLLGAKTGGHLELANSVSVEQKYLRQSLFENLIVNLQDNLRFFSEFNIFEVGRVYLPSPGIFHINNLRQQFLPAQEKYLAGLKINNSQTAPFFEVKGLVEGLLQSLEVSYELVKEKNQLPWLDPANYLEVRANHQQLGFVAQLNQAVLGRLEIIKPVGVWEINFSQLIKHVADKKKYQPLPKYPGIIYDVSLIIPKEATWAEIAKEVYEISPLIKKVELFDVFEVERLGPDKRSLAFHVHFQSEERTLEAKEAENLREKIIKSLDKKFKASIR